MYRLKVKTHFDAAHQLNDYQGKCSRLHGHRWDVEAVVSGNNLLAPQNMLIDFTIVKGTLKVIMEQLDHYNLNDVLGTRNPTAEYLAQWIFGCLKGTIEVYAGAVLESICVWESPDCCVEYTGEEYHHATK